MLNKAGIIFSDRDPLSSSRKDNLESKNVIVTDFVKDINIRYADIDRNECDQLLNDFDDRAL